MPQKTGKLLMQPQQFISIMRRGLPLNAMQDATSSEKSGCIGFGNPFEDDCPEVLVLNSRDCVHDDVIETVISH